MPMDTKRILGVLLLSLAIPACSDPSVASAEEKAAKPTTQPSAKKEDKVVKTDAEWRKQLTPEQYNILRQKGTERAFTGAYWNNHEKGTYLCAGCGWSCSAPTPSSTPAPAGRASGRRSTRVGWRRAPTPRTA
jgi:hypothetical protein